MKTLMIRDLSRTETLDARAMASVHGGTMKGGSPFTAGWLDASQHSFSFDAQQGISQSQNTEVNNGNNAAFVCGITSTVKPTQDAHNNINFG